MTNLTVVEHDIETNQVKTRKMNAEELAQFEADALKTEAEAQLKATKAAEKAALLTKLGITDDEAKLLLS